MHTVLGTSAHAHDQSTQGPSGGHHHGPNVAEPMTTRPEWANELHVAPVVTAPALARAFVEEYCHQRDLSYLVDDIRLVVSELVTNAVVHARSRIRVTIQELSFCVRLVVYDESVDVPLPSLGNRVVNDSENGRGLWIVDACSTDWGTDLNGDEGKSTWAVFAVRPKSSWGSD